MYKVLVTHNRDLVFRVKVGEGEFVIDAKGKGITPLDALLAGLGSCIGVYIRKYAKGAKIELKNFQVNVLAELTGQAPLCFKNINVDIDLKSCPLDDRRKEALLRFIKNCPVHNTLKGNLEIEFKLLC